MIIIVNCYMPRPITGPGYLNIERMQIFHSDDDLLDRKRLDPILNSFLP